MMNPQAKTAGRNGGHWAETGDIARSPGRLDGRRFDFRRSVPRGARWGVSPAPWVPAPLVGNDRQENRESPNPGSSGWGADVSDPDPGSDLGPAPAPAPGSGPVHIRPRASAPGAGPGSAPGPAAAPAL